MFKQTLLKLGVVAMAIALGVAFVWNRMQSAEVRQRILGLSASEDGTILTDTTPTTSHHGLMATMARMGVVIDIYGDGGLITIDSLKRRIAHGRFVLPTSKSSGHYEERTRDQAYLDSLVNYLKIPLDHSTIVGTVVTDSFGTGDMVTIDSLMRRAASQGWLMYNGEWYVAPDSFSREWDYLKRQIELADHAQ